MNVPSCLLRVTVSQGVIGCQGLLKQHVQLLLSEEGLNLCLLHQIKRTGRDALFQEQRPVASFCLCFPCEHNPCLSFFPAGLRFLIYKVGVRRSWTTKGGSRCFLGVKQHFCRVHAAFLEQMKDSGQRERSLKSTGTVQAPCRPSWVFFSMNSAACPAEQLLLWALLQCRKGALIGSATPGGNAQLGPWGPHLDQGQLCEVCRKRGLLSWLGPGNSGSGSASASSYRGYSSDLRSSGP